MRVLSLRAPERGAPQVELHPRLTVVVGATDRDRADLRAAFRSLVGVGPSPLEVRVDVHGVPMAAESSFAATFGLADGPDPVLEVPVSGERTPAPGSHGEAANELDAVRAEERRLAGALTVLQRELDAGPGGVARTSHPDRVRALARDLRSAQREEALPDPLVLAERLEEVERRRRGARPRHSALVQLARECHVALVAARDTLAELDESRSDPANLRRLDLVREDLSRLADLSSPSRRERRRLDALRAEESAILAQMGHTTYVSYLLGAAHAAGNGDATDDMRAGLVARIELLEQLAAYWESVHDRMEADRREEMALVEQATALLGLEESPERPRSARLLAARLRSAPRRAVGAFHDLDRLADELRSELGAGAEGVRDVSLLLSLAETSTGEDGAQEALRGNGTAQDPLLARESQLRSRLAATTRRRQALERSAAVLRTLDEGSGVEVLPWDALPGDRGAGPPGGGAPHGWSLQQLLAGLQDVRTVGGMPALVEEPRGVPHLLEGVDPRSVLALSGEVQVVWVTDRAEVADVLESLADLARVIRC